MLDAQSQATFVEGLRAVAGKRRGRSVVLRDRNGAGAALLHLIPAPQSREHAFSKIECYVLLAKPTSALLPAADIISGLFDLTPAEARVAREVALGKSPQRIAAELKLSPETIRSHLKRVFNKTSVSRQSELVALLANIR